MSLSWSGVQHTQLILTLIHIYSTKEKGPISSQGKDLSKRQKYLQAIGGIHGDEGDIARVLLALPGLLTF